MIVEAEVQESVESEWVTIGGQRYKMTFVNDAATDEDYLRFLEYKERKKNDKERKKV